MEIVMELNLPSEYETRIYVSEGGNLCIEQQESLDARQPVVLSPNQVKVLLYALPDLLAKARLAFAQYHEVDDEQES
jgi:hypothetical protein